MWKVHKCILPHFETCAIFWKYLQNIWVGGNGFCQKHKLPLQKLAGAHHIHFSIYLYFFWKTHNNLSDFYMFDVNSF